MKISQEGLDLIKSSEGLMLQSYLCPAGVATIGYGSTIVNNLRVKMGEGISKEGAEQALLEHLSHDIYPVIKTSVHVALTQGQFDAICDFIYNLGSGAFVQSTLLKKLNAGDYVGAGGQFKRWVYAAGKKLKGLEIRRNLELILFNS